jgi:hypothetical protein
MGALESLVPVIAFQAQDWIEQQRAMYLHQARSLTDFERSALAGHFSAEILTRVRVAFVERISNPPFLATLLQQLSLFGKQVQFDFSNSAGITFGECILIPGEALPVDLLFHEMVHVEQYGFLGISDFARAYVQGIMNSDFIYERIPLEIIAFEMSDRFISGEAFSPERRALGLAPANGIYFLNAFPIVATPFTSRGKDSCSKSATKLPNSHSPPTAANSSH